MKKDAWKKNNQLRNAEIAAQCRKRLHLNARPSTFQFAKENRKNATDAERILWSYLRNRQLKGKKFRRQHAILNYILDFYCHECKLDIELDGNYHRDSSVENYDMERTANLKKQGITVLRFWNDEVLRNPVQVLEKISKHLD